MALSKNKRKKKRKKGSLTAAKKKCWKAFSLLIKLSHSHDGINCKCYTCGASLKIGTANCQGGHMFPQGGFSGIWLERNNVRPQCYRCNVNLGGNGAIFAEKMIKEVGQKEYDRLSRERHREMRLTASEYDELTEQFNREVLELKRKHGIFPL